MKKIFTIVMAAAMVASCTNKAKFTISGESDKFAGKYAYLQVEEGRELKTIDSVAVAGNAFVLEGIAEQPYVAYVVIKEVGAERPELFTKLYVEPADIAIKAIEGEKRTTLAAIGGNLNGIVDQINSYLSEFEELMQSEDKSVAQAAEKSWNYTMVEAIKGCKGNLVAQDLLKANYYAFEPQQVLDAIATMPAEKQEEFANMKKSAEQALKVLPGNKYINIVDKTPEGEELSLKSVIENKNNKYVLIDFWASWCGPCMREVPYLVETYKNYHKKGFEIFGVSFDRTKEAWVKAIEDKQLTWPHVSSVKYWDNQARHDYAVNSIPANFLVDCSTGEIIATALRGEELQAKIAELLK
ncbi:MAG: AhpC/TSA family protein [Alistipes sp.]|nr:AhpC/TSA family protein [Alistipes sp.]